MSIRTPIGPVIFCCAALASLSVHPAGAAELAPEQRRAIESVIHDYLLQHPDVLIDALRAAEEKLKSDAGEKAKQSLVVRRKEIFDDPETPVGGNPKADVTLVEFFDYRCPYCKQVEPRLRELLDIDRLKRDIASPQIDAALNANKALADALDIRGTPGFVIGDQIVPGAIELASLKELVAEARKK